MIPQKEEREVLSSGADDSANFEISAEDTAHIMTILRDTLYSDKIMAVLREYGTNAWDANRMAGRGEVPIEVTLPTLGTPELVIRDRGPGLSHEDIGRIYTKYGASTKRADNVAAGMLGIGSKSGFAYSDSFTITSWNGGKKRIYVAVLNDEKGRCDLIHTEDCQESETGVEIKIAVKPQDCAAFEERAKRLFVHFEPQPKINCQLPAPQPARDVPGHGRILDDDSWEGRGKWYAVMGPVAYKIDLQQLSGEAGGQRLATAASDVGGYLPFEIGELQIAASREGLKYGDLTRANLIRRINDLIDEYVRTMLVDIDKVSQWERRLRIRAIERRRLPLPPQFRNKSHYVTLTAKPSFVVSVKNYNNRMAPTSHLNVDPGVRFVLKDERKAMAGYKLTDKDLVVGVKDGFTMVSGLGAGSDLLLARILQDLKQMIKELEIEGIEIAKLSSIPWTQPKDDDGKAKAPRDAARAKAQSFVFDTTKPYYDDERAKSWAIVTRAPKEDDVFVILESYRVDGMEGFYETYQQDAELLKGVGLSMPPVYGYKSTKAKPVYASNQKGTEYRKWRVTGMVKLLLGIPAVANALAGASYDQGYRLLDHHVLKQMLGEKHPVVEYAAAENSGKMAWSKAPAAVRMAVNHVRNSVKPEELEAERRRLALQETYPLLKVSGMNAFREGFRDLWVDYVKLIDSQQQPKQQEEAA